MRGLDQPADCSLVGNCPDRHSAVDGLSTLSLNSIRAV